MSLIETMLRTHPHPPAQFETLQSAIVAADACLAEAAPEELRNCIRIDLDCADVCLATGSLLSRIGAGNVELRQAQLRACLLACQLCETECMHHAKRHEHCRICAQACRSCHEACARLLEAPPRAH